MSTPCPEPSVWVLWSEGKLPEADRARWRTHLAACADCRDELASLAREYPLPAPPSRRLPLAAAAALLLVAGVAVWRLSSPRTPVPSGPGVPGPGVSATLPAARIPVPSQILEAASPTEALWGRAGLVTLDALSRARLEQGAFTLLEGEALVETAGEPLRILLSGWDGELAIEDAQVLLRASPARSQAGLFLASAWAQDSAEGSWGILVLRGRAVAGSRTLGAGESLGVPPRPRNGTWQEAAGIPWRVRDASRAVMPDLPEGAWIGEVLLRKGEDAAETALLFRAGGRGWRVPLGAHLAKGDAWVRFRLEVGGGHLRLLGGARELLSCPVERLSEHAYAAEAFPFGIQAWGGDMEVRQGRWRASHP